MLRALFAAVLFLGGCVVPTAPVAEPDPPPPEPRFPRDGGRAYCDQNQYEVMVVPVYGASLPCDPCTFEVIED